MVKVGNGRCPNVLDAFAYSSVLYLVGRLTNAVCY